MKTKIGVSATKNEDGTMTVSLSQSMTIAKEAPEQALFDGKDSIDAVLSHDEVVAPATTEGGDEAKA